LRRVFSPKGERSDVESSAQFRELLSQNIQGIHDLKIVNTEAGLIEAFAEYAKKCGINDAFPLERVRRLKQYKGKLDTIEKKFATIAAEHSLI